MKNPVTNMSFNTYHITRNSLRASVFLFALATCYVIRVAPALAVPCPADGICPAGQHCARYEGLEGGSACLRTCDLSAGEAVSGCSSSEACRTITGEDVCLPRSAFSDEVPTDTTTESGVGDVVETPPFTPIVPRLGIQIPGTTLSPAVDLGGVISVPYLSQYVNGVYRYLVTIVLIVSIVMVVYGGFRYLVGASMGDIQTGKKIIVDALAGMLITLGAYMILNTVNPATVSLDAIQLTVVEREGLEFVSSEDYRAATGMDTPSRAEVAAMVRTVATELGLDECGLSAVTIGESGGRADAIGYDSNVPRVGIFSRRAFIRSGRRYSGSTFPVPAGTWSGPECRPSSEGLNAAQIAAIQDRSIRNDARFNPTAAPDFGLDDRFSVGIGAGQVTLLPDRSTCRLPRCPNGLLGREVEGTCYSVPELLQPRPQMLAAASIYRRAYNGCDEYSDPYVRQRCTFARYGGEGCSVRVGACSKMKLWAACRGVAHREVTNCREYWLSKESDYCNDFRNN